MNNPESIVECDLLVIGGGINGTGVARDAAGRGLSVILCEKDDFASHTSSASSKLIHGGLRYLEFYEFGLVRKALLEREALLKIAPHLITPLNFVMPHRKGLRPRWLLRLALLVYDHLAPRELLQAARSIHFSTDKSGQGLQKYLKHGFRYTDAWVDDARLVVLNAVDAKERGARLFSRIECTALNQVDGRWEAKLESRCNSETQVIKVVARAVVNAGGAWAGQIQNLAESGLTTKLRLVKGSHLIVKKLYSGTDAYLFQHPDGRIVFALPFQDQFTLIGTTDLEYEGDLNQIAITDAEINYLCELSNQYFETQISARDVVSSYAGVRPLVDDGNDDAKAITRDYHLHLVDHGAPIVHVFGGKITTYRRLAEDVFHLLSAHFHNSRPDWTSKELLPGGDLSTTFPSRDNVLHRDAFVADCVLRYNFVNRATIQRMAQAYGSRIHVILEGCLDEEALGPELVPNLFTREIDYLVKNEFATTADDILWRRTKLGLFCSEADHARLKDYVKSYFASTKSA
ncbi:glycerol-3-phosphate dehydrogenase [Undibacterium fentianense]|uniref:Glycerol-3-phosphate dehydrogenase n=1 Tax=Undibacterium fentianense TaxID=2828728 RepID=A0A941E646_9BURK|nr:glycerol-3-phosphate dehydrogenase [Undibacterium fentianense]MBR7801792.1 glycerol-3-phosphate dehydrogenase [Undibacterium fentianense]